MAGPPELPWLARTNLIGVDNGSTLVINGQFTANSNPLAKVGLGTLEMAGGVANTNTGTITVNDGTLRLNKLPGAGGGVGPVFVVGDNSGPGTDTLELKSPEQLAAGSDVTVNSTGLLRKTTAAPASTENEVQNLVITGSSGSFQVTFAGSQTAALPFNVTPSGRFFRAGNEIQQITNQNGNLNGDFRISFQTSPGSPVYTTGNIVAYAAANDDGDITHNPQINVLAALENAQLPTGETIGEGNVMVDGPDGGPYVVTFIGRFADQNFPLMKVQNINVNGAPNFQVQAIQDGGILGSATASLENALNSLPSKPANLTFNVTGVPGNYVITMVDSNAVKADQLPLSVVAVGGATASVTTLLDGGTNGGYDNTESIRSLKLVMGSNSSGKVDIGAGAYVVARFGCQRRHAARAGGHRTERHH